MQLFLKRLFNVSSRHAFLAAALLLGTLSGCGGKETGPEKFTVTGNVTVDGAPLEKGRIQFRAGGNGKAFVGEITDGEYSLETEAGSMTVEITASRAIPGKFDEGASPDDEPQPIMEMYIPEQYNSKTTLKADVTPDGENKFPFELVTK